MRIHETAARPCETRGVNDEQAPLRGSAAATATLYSWIANRLWTYRGRTQENATREAILFFFANACGIGITQFCLLFTHHILGYTSALADNIAAYVVGFALGTAFRFFFYHYVVFTGHTRA